MQFRSKKFPIWSANLYIQSKVISFLIWLTSASILLQMGSSLYDINEVSIERAFDFVIDEPGLMPNGYYFVSNTIQQQTVFFAGFDRSYDQISINFDIHRRSTYFLRLVNWPGSILMLLTLTLFFLPPSAPERILYGTMRHNLFSIFFSIHLFQARCYSCANFFY